MEPLPELLLSLIEGDLRVYTDVLPLSLTKVR